MHVDAAANSTSALETVTTLLRTPDGLRIENRADEAFVQAMLAAALQPHRLGAYLYTVTLLGAVAYALAPVVQQPAGQNTQPCATVPHNAAHGPTADGQDSQRELAPLLDTDACASPRPSQDSAAPKAAPTATGVHVRPISRGAAFGPILLALDVGWRLLVGIASILMLGVILLPFESIAHRNVADLVPACGGLRDATVALHGALRPYHVSNSYGLFRRMTGVGPRQANGVPERLGWGGLPPSIVQVPVVVIEGHARMQDDSTKGGGWREIPFRYTPFGVRRSPRRTAPHQPRLDWQMWFVSCRRASNRGRPEESHKLGSAEGRVRITLCARAGSSRLLPAQPVAAASPLQDPARQ